MKKAVLIISITLISILVGLSGACSSGSAPTANNPITGKVIKSGPIGNMTVTLASDTGKLKNGDQDITVTFTDAAGKAVDVGAASLSFMMPAMGSMSQMNAAAALTTSGTPGAYKGKVKISMAGDWQAQIAIEGSAGNSKTSLPVSAQ